jgi:hypothetical protein
MKDKDPQPGDYNAVYPTPGGIPIKFSKEPVTAKKSSKKPKPRKPRKNSPMMEERLAELKMRLDQIIKENRKRRR